MKSRMKKYLALLFVTMLLMPTISNAYFGMSIVRAMDLESDDYLEDYSFDESCAIVEDEKVTTEAELANSDVVAEEMNSLNAEIDITEQAENAQVGSTNVHNPGSDMNEIETMDDEWIVGQNELSGVEVLNDGNEADNNKSLLSTSEADFNADISNEPGTAEIENAVEDVEKPENVETELVDNSSVEELLPESSNDAVKDNSVAEVTNSKTTDKENLVGSMLPLKEEKAYLVIPSDIEDYGIDIQKFPVSLLAEMLILEDGSSAGIPEDAKIIWTYLKDSEGKTIHDEYHELFREDTIDLSSISDSEQTYLMELIIGSGKQLDNSSIRYIVRVYLSDEQQEALTYSLWKEKDGIREKIEVDPKTSAAKVINNMQYVQRVYAIKDIDEDAEYYIGINSILSEHPFVDVNVYDGMSIIDGYNGSGDLNDIAITPISDRVVNVDMSQPGNGLKLVKGTELTASIANTVAVCFEDPKTGVLYDNPLLFGFFVTKDTQYFEGGAYLLQDGGMEKVDRGIQVQNLFDDITEYQIEDKTISIPQYYTHSFLMTVYLDHGYSVDEEYYYAADFYTAGSDVENEHVIGAYKGYFTTIEEAKQSGAENLQNTLTPVDKSGIYGVKGNYSYKNYSGTAEDNWFTVFLDSGLSYRLLVLFKEYPSDSEYYFKEYDDAPIIGAKDPWFRVTGLMLDGRLLDTYVVENGKAINMDTYYGYGYQTVMVNESLSPEEMSRLVPIFEVGDEKRVKVRTLDSVQPLSSGVDKVDFSDDNGTEQFIAIIDDNSKNYQVHVLSKQSGPKLYVYDDHTDSSGRRFREVILDDYFEEKHDILIANIGDELLTGLKVKLDATNVKLNDYWTVGGEGNDSLAPFITTTDKSKYGLIPNIAKIRLLPDGEGDIEGKLTISADGQEDVVIYISNHPRQPEIVNMLFEKAVKFVPYSYMVATDNMYEWNDETFSIVDGSLPPGMNIYPSTGEIYGAPLEAGTYTFTVKVDYSRDDYFEPSEKEFSITVEDNENQRVYETSDDGYEIIPVEDGENGFVGEQVSPYDFVLTTVDEDEVFISEGEYNQFVKLWLNGEELVEGVDYTKKPGSTKLTIISQTLKEKTTDGRNTISAEFNIDDERGEKLKRTSQNFRVELASKEPTNPDDSSQSDAPEEPTDSLAPEEPTESIDEQDIDTVGVTTHIVGANGQALVNYIVEMHSKVQTSVTDTSGNASFDEVEMGDHTVYIKNEAGTTVASKNFRLQAGSAFSENGDTFTVVPGQMMSMTIRVGGSNASIENAKSVNSTKLNDSDNSTKSNGSKTANGTTSSKDTNGTSSAIENPAKTSDNSDICLWVVSMLLSTAIVFMLGSRKKSNVK